MQDPDPEPEVRFECIALCRICGEKIHAHESVYINHGIAQHLVCSFRDPKQSQLPFDHVEPGST